MVDGIGTNRYTCHPGGQLYTEDLPSPVGYCKAGGPWDNVSGKAASPCSCEMRRVIWRVDRIRLTAYTCGRV
jgi:rubredoxin